MKTQFDVVIVGGGPAGSACATMLAQTGISVLVCEKTKFPREKICGDCVNPRCWPMFDELGVGGRLRALIFPPIDSLTITTSKGRQPSATVLNNSSSPFFAIERSLLDIILLHNAGKSGAIVSEETKVENIQCDDCWHVTASGQMISSRILVLADGRNSLIGKLDPAHHSIAEDQSRVGLQWYNEYLPQVGTGLEMIFFDSGYCGLVNIGKNHSNIAMVTTGENARLAQKDFDHFLERTIFQTEPPQTMRDKLCPLDGIATAFPIDPRRNLNKHRTLFLIGDARATVEPFTGEGIFFALQDGIHAASKIARLLGSTGRTYSTSRRSSSFVNTIASSLLRGYTANRFFPQGPTIYSNTLMKLGASMISIKIKY